MRRLYQTRNILPFLTSVLVLMLSTTGQRVYAAYDNPLCDFDDDGTSECRSGQACTKTGPISYQPYECSDVVAPTGCSPQCSSNEVCKPYFIGGTTCVEGSIITTTTTQSKIRCSPGAPHLNCPSGSTCTSCTGTDCYCVNTTTGEFETRTNVSQQRSASFGIEEFLNFWNQGYAQDESAFGKFMTILYRIILPVGIVLGTLYVIISGYMLMTSQGDPQKALEAKEQLTSAIMGVLFVLLGAGILRAIISTLIQGASPGF